MRGVFAEVVPVRHLVQGAPGRVADEAVARAHAGPGSTGGGRGVEGRGRLPQDDDDRARDAQAEDDPEQALPESVQPLLATADLLETSLHAQLIATIRSIAPRARSAISGSTVTTCFQSRSESRSFSSVIIFMYLQIARSETASKRLPGASLFRR